MIFFWFVYAYFLSQVLALFIIKKLEINKFKINKSLLNNRENLFQQMWASF